MVGLCLGIDKCSGAFAPLWLLLLTNGSLKDKVKPRRSLQTGALTSSLESFPSKLLSEPFFFFQQERHI